MRVLQRRPTNPVDVWQQERYVRALRMPEGVALVEVWNRGTVDAPDLRYVVRHGAPATGAHERLARMLRRVLGLDVDPAPLARLAEAERRLRPTAIALRGMRPPRFTCLFETFLNVVPFQQLSLDAGLAVVGRLVERFGEHLEQDGRRFQLFPTAGSIAGARLDALRRCGLSARRAESLRFVARLIASGQLTEERLAALSTDEALRVLTDLPGIGPWSAGLVLLRGLGRLEVFPSGDVGAARGLRRVLRLPPEASLARIIGRFGDARGYLYFCALGGSLLEKGLIHAAPSPRAPRW